MTTKENPQRKATPKAIGLILARGGSKGIPLKNIKLLNGRPLLNWTLHAMRDSGVTDEIWVSTDHDEIERIAVEGGARVHRRITEVSQDNTPSIVSVLEFVDVQNPQCDVIVRAQATAPCIRPEHYRELMKKYIGGGFDSMFTVTRRHPFRWKEVENGSSSEALNFDPSNRQRRQDAAGELCETGAVYVTSLQALKATRTFQGGDKVGYYEMAPHLCVDIDDPDDWHVAEDKVRRYGYNPAKTVGRKSIRLLVCDADGTLTDGKIYVGADSGWTCSYHSRDATGIRRIQQRGVDVKIVTTSRFAHRETAKEINATIANKCEDKLAQVDEWRQEMRLEWSQVAYIGDDESDLECINMAGVGGAPSDAEEVVKSAAQYIAPVGGGLGAVNNFCKYLMETCQMPQK